MIIVREKQDITESINDEKISASDFISIVQGKGRRITCRANYATRSSVVYTEVNPPAVCYISNGCFYFESARGNDIKVYFPVKAILKVIHHKPTPVSEEFTLYLKDGTTLWIIF